MAAGASSDSALPGNAGLTPGRLGGPCCIVPGTGILLGGSRSCGAISSQTATCVYSCRRGNGLHPTVGLLGSLAETSYTLDRRVELRKPRVPERVRYQCSGKEMKGRFHVNRFVLAILACVAGAATYRFLAGALQGSGRCLCVGRNDLPEPAKLVLMSKAETSRQNCQLEALRDSQLFDGRKVDDTEEKLMKLVADRARNSGIKRSVLVDVGANVGLFTGLLCRHFPGSLIHSFEPGDETRSWLMEVANNSKECKKSGTSVVVHKEAASNTDGQPVVLRGNPPKSWKPQKGGTVKPHNTGASIASAVNDMRGQVAILGRTVTARLDTILADYPRVELVKTDTEGLDAIALKGLEKKLQDGSVELIYWEYGFKTWAAAASLTKIDLPDVVRWLHGLGYSSYAVSSAGLLRISGDCFMARALLEIDYTANIMSIRQASLVYANLAADFPFPARK